MIHLSMYKHRQVDHNDTCLMHILNRKRFNCFLHGCALYVCLNVCLYPSLSLPGRPTLGFEPVTASCCACREQTACSASAEGFQRSAAVDSACLGC